MTIEHTWRLIFWVSVALTSGTAVLMFFTLPETVYIRNTRPSQLGNQAEHPATEKEEGDYQVENIALQCIRVVGKPPRLSTIPRTNPMKSWTTEPIWKLVFRPVILIILPSVLWACLVMSVAIGFLVAVSSNFATAFTLIYGFQTWQQGFCWFAGVIGAVTGIFFGGYLSDKCADYLTVRNGGIREPEMRLPAMAISIITGPLSFVLYGVGIGNHMHWIVPVIGVGLRKLPLAF
jgi:hypothetical protein